MILRSTRLGYVFRRCSYLSVSSVSRLLTEKPVNSQVLVQGWVKAVRKQKDITFVDVDDGSDTKKIQVVLESSKRPSNLGFHSTVEVVGMLINSSFPGQEVEVLASHLKVIGSVTELKYPFKARKVLPSEYIRQHIHLRPRTNTFSSLLRLRSQTKRAVCRYFEDEGFINIDTPIITSNDCEGGGEVFEIKPLKSCGGTSKDEAKTEKYFGTTAYLTVSGQLHLEAMASGLSRVYNFSPAFRAENSQTRRHLSEFWMIEAEEVILSGDESLNTLMDRIEGVLKGVLVQVLQHPSDLHIHWKQNEGTEDLVAKADANKFIRLPYTEAMHILSQHSSRFRVAPVLGRDLAKEHENFLTEHCNNIPVMVYDWPKETKPFYMAKKTSDESVSQGVDLLVPYVGELVGGGMRESCPYTLQQYLESTDSAAGLDWYVDLRRNGYMPTGGFGLGFERLLQFLSGIKNIRDTIPFPRWPKHCTG